MGVQMSAYPQLRIVWCELHVSTRCGLFEDACPCGHVFNLDGFAHHVFWQHAQELAELWYCSDAQRKRGNQRWFDGIWRKHYRSEGVTNNHLSGDVECHCTLGGLFFLKDCQDSAQALWVGFHVMGLLFSFRGTDARSTTL